MNPLSHVAIIMDGNGRWASKKLKPRIYGHKEGLKNIKNIIDLCILNKIKYLTLYVFSYDNWKRPKAETAYLFNLLNSFLKKDLSYLIKNQIKIKIIGEKKKLKKKLIKTLWSVEKKTKKKVNSITINLAFNYSSKLEIINAFKKIFLKNKIKKINTDLVDKYLYTTKIPDPEILIRTGGNNRLSDFLLWQLSYTEIFFIKKYWPDFNCNDLQKIINKFLKIKRNFGAINQ